MPSSLSNYNLAIINPQLAKEWQSLKNLPLTIKTITPKSSKKVWWKCKKGHEWEATVNNRSKGKGCPFCSGRYASKKNNLAMQTPGLTKEWHPTKNGDLRPEEVTPRANKKVWWICSKGHEWKALISSRSNGVGCPYCAGKKICSDNCLLTVNVGLASEWHPTKNGRLSPKDVFPNSHRKIWWLCKNRHEWKTSVASRNHRGRGCPYCTNQRVNSENCLGKINPKLSKEWHPTKNKALTPDDVTPGTGKKVWWCCKKGHEWLATVKSRNNGRRCPYCFSQTSMLELQIFSEMKYLFDNVEHRKILNGYEVDVYIPYYKIAIEIDGGYWHKEKYESDKLKTIAMQKSGIVLHRLREKGLRKITSFDVVFSSKDNVFDLVNQLLINMSKVSDFDSAHKKIVEKYQRGKKFANESQFIKMWEMLPSPLPQDSLALQQKKIANQWDLEKNGSLTARDVSCQSHKKVWWICEKGHSYLSMVSSRSRGRGCPYCSRSKVNYENSLSNEYPELAKEWHPTKNGDLKPVDVLSGSSKKVWWLCGKSHEWKTYISYRSQGGVCPYCSGRKVGDDNNLQKVNSKLAKEWDFKRNKEIKPSDVTPYSHKSVWWKCSNGHSWKARVANRSIGRGCPYCSGRRKWDQSGTEHV